MAQGDKLFSIKIFVDDMDSPISPETGYLAIRESMDFLVPSATIEFQDIDSWFLTKYPFIQDTEIKVSMYDDENTKNSSFFVFNFSADQQPSFNDSFNFKLNLISKYANPLMLDSEFHSKRCKASDYIKYLADRLGLKYDVEETSDVKVWINPGWKYPQMIRYLATHCLSKSGSSGYMYYVTFDGKLIFKSVDRLFEEGGEGESISLDLVKGDGRQFKYSSSIFSSVVFGSNNLTLSAHDFNTSQNISKTIKFDQYLKKRGLKSGVSSKFSSKFTNKYIGEFFSKDLSEPYDFSKEVFKKILLSSEQNIITMTMLAKPFSRSVGSVVNLTIPSERGTGINLNMSGRYLVKNILTKGRTDYMQTIQLIRQGINLNDRDNLV